MVMVRTFDAHHVAPLLFVRSKYTSAHHRNLACQFFFFSSKNPHHAELVLFVASLINWLHALHYIYSRLVKAGTDVSSSSGPDARR